MTFTQSERKERYERQKIIDFTNRRNCWKQAALNVKLTQKQTFYWGTAILLISVPARSWRRGWKMKSGIQEVDGEKQSTRRCRAAQPDHWKPHVDRFPVAVKTMNSGSPPGPLTRPTSGPAEPGIQFKLLTKNILWFSKSFNRNIWITISCD